MRDQLGLALERQLELRRGPDLLAVDGPRPKREQSGWLPDYSRRWLRADAVAGVTLAAYLLPADIADASLPGLPPEAGLYGCLFGGLVFFFATEPARRRAAAEGRVPFPMPDPAAFVRHLQELTLRGLAPDVPDRPRGKGARA